MGLIRSLEMVLLQHVYTEEDAQRLGVPPGLGTTICQSKELDVYVDSQTLLGYLDCEDVNEPVLPPVYMRPLLAHALELEGMLIRDVRFRRVSFWKIDDKSKKHAACHALANESCEARGPRLPQGKLHKLLTAAQTNLEGREHRDKTPKRD